MKIALLSTSRADYSALAVARLALLATKEHALTSLVYHTAPSFDVMLADLKTAKPDLVMVHGDRWDALMAATAATVARSPVGHVGGGDVTRGAYDDRFRNAITILADWHFVASYESRQRLLRYTHQDRIFVIGELAIDWLATVDLTAAWDALNVRLGLQGRPYVLVNWQPETASKDMNAGLKLIIEALRSLGADLMQVFVKPGDDAGSHEAMLMLTAYRASDDRVRYMHDGMSRTEYAAAMKCCRCVVGNSSSGLIEAPVFSRPFVLVGDRQAGRAIPGNTACLPTNTMPQNLAHAIQVHAEIGVLASNEATTEDNPYGDGRAGEKLVAAVQQIVGRIAA